MGICPLCLKKVQAQVIEMEGKIYLRKCCSVHGLSDALICSDADWFNKSKSFNKPGQETRSISVNKFNGCPESCGLCPQHLQHTCLPVIEILSDCDMSCPVCLKRFEKEFKLDLKEFTHILDTVIRCERQVPIVNISGGEPLLHPQLKEFLEMCIAKGITQPTVSTNGMRFLDEPSLIDAFRSTSAIVALQFDGLNTSSNVKLRGRDFTKKKLDVINLLEKEKISYSLVAVVARGLNEDEIPAIVDFFFESKAISLMFQPLSFTGKACSMKSNEMRLTIPDVIKSMAGSRFVRQQEFIPLPCSHYSCYALSYYLATEPGEFVNLLDVLGKEDFMEIISNRTLPGLDLQGYSTIKEKLYQLWSAADTCTPNDKILKRIKAVFKELEQVGYSPRNAFRIGAESMKGIFIHQFMDVDTLDFNRLSKCCTHYPKTDGRLIPMCAQNVFFQGN